MWQLSRKDVDYSDHFVQLKKKFLKKNIIKDTNSNWIGIWRLGFLSLDFETHL
jgi:hypothetical protein